MPRPQRKRRVCQKPKYDTFIPKDYKNAKQSILTVDEYETIRCIDYQKMTQEQCANIMDISRTTVAEIYQLARYKISDCIVNGKMLQIEGGNYKLCDGEAGGFCHMKCNKNITSIIIEKGDGVMRIAVTYNDGEVFQHFGHTEEFKLYDVEDGKVIDTHIINTNGSGHGALSLLLANEKADMLICGGIGGGAKVALAEANITVYGGVTGAADAAVQAFLQDKLEFNPNVQCSHHHEDGHECGENKHGCGGN